MLNATVPWPAPVPAPGASNVVMLPFRVRRKPVSYDRSRRVNGERQCALAGACPSTRRIECGNSRLRAAHVAEILAVIARAARGRGREDTQQQDRSYGGS